MEATLKQIRDGNHAIQLLLGAKLPVKAAYAVSKLATACANEMEHYGKQREKMFKDAGCSIVKTGEKDKDGNELSEWQHPEDKEKVTAVVAATEEMMESKVSLNALSLDLEQFGSGDLLGAAFYALDWAMKAA